MVVSGAWVSLDAELLLNFLLIRTWATWGAVGATLLSFAFLSAASYWASIRVYPFHCNFALIAKIFGASAVLLLAGFAVRNQSFGMRVAIKLGLAAVFMFVLAKSRALPEGFIAALCGDAMNWLRMRLGGRAGIYARVAAPKLKGFSPGEK